MCFIHCWFIFFLSYSLPIIETAETDVAEVPKKDKGPLIFGYSLKDPQDILSIVLIGVITYNAVDLAVYFAKKLFTSS